MSTYKKLNKQDAYITTYTAHKTWAVTGSALADYGIEVIEATDNYLNSLRQLYYPNKVSGSIPSHSFDYYTQTTLNYSSSRTLATGSNIYSIPRELFGVNIKPASFQITLTNLVNALYVSGTYWTGSYEVPPIDFRSPPTSSVTILDDGEGNLYLSGSSPVKYLGDIIYPHGLAILTDLQYDYLADANTLDKIIWQTSHPILTHNYHCKIRESEYNYTYNPTALTSSLKATYDNDGYLYSTSSKSDTGYRRDNITGSAFQPYITTVGLYNDANELIAVGKMSQPVPKSANTEMTIIVKIDI